MDVLNLAQDVLTQARKAQLKIATAESCTGGLIFATLTEIAGSSDVMDRGFVTYSNNAKTQMLGVDAKLIEKNGAVSTQVAQAMAQGALARSDAQMALSVTGVAGPGGTAAKPEGMVCFGLARSGAAGHAETQKFGAIGRALVRQKSTHHALTLLAMGIAASA